MRSSDDSFERTLAHTLAEPLIDPDRRVLDARVEETIAAAVMARATPRRRSRVTRRSLLLAAALMVGLPAVFGVSAAVLSTEDPLGLADSAEFEAELDVAKREVPIPAGRAWPAFLQADGSSSYSRGGARSWAEWVAVCLWLDEWADARADQRPDRERLAARTIAGIPSWSSWNSPFWTQSVRDHLVPVIAAVGAGDDAAIEREVVLNCGFARGD